ncbi:MAG: hypothetical protein AB8B69_04770 [Chitinophagales bacterium]
MKYLNLNTATLFIFVYLFSTISISCLTTSTLSAQCNPTIHINSIDSNDSFCQSDAPFEVSVNEVVEKGLFIGQGIIDSDSTDNKAIFDPSKVSYGNHTIGFVVLEGGNGACQKGDNASLPIQVLPHYEKNPIGEVTICADGTNQISLIDYIQTRVRSDGTWNTINDITPTSRSGTISPDQLQQLEAGTHLFTYTDPRFQKHTSCPTVAVKLNITQPPSATKIDSVEAVCEGDRAYVCLDGLVDGYYTATYSIGLEEMPVSDTFISINGKAFFMTTELSNSQQQQPIRITTITNTQSNCHQTIKDNSLVSKLKIIVSNIQ